MQDAHAFLENVALVLCVAGVTTVVCQRLRQPVVFGYLLAGMIVGPHLPIPLFAAGAIIAISSTPIIVKTFDEQQLTGRFTELVLGILIFEDLFAILLLAILTT